MKKLNVFALVLSLAMVSSFALTACKGDGELGNSYTQYDYITTTPATWNELDSTDANNDAIMGYIGSSFFTYDYEFEGGKFKADGSINVEGIVPGSFTTEYNAAIGLEDVTSSVDAKWGYDDKKKAEGGYAWKITLRDDLKWDDGTAIKAEDFVYSMKEQLNPLFQLGRMDSYYSNAVKIRNAKPYVYQGQSGMFPAVEVEGFGKEISSFDGLYFDATNVNAFGYTFGSADMTSLAAYADAGYFTNANGVNVFEALVDYAGDDRVPMTQEIADLLKSLYVGGPLAPYWGWVDTEIGYFTVAEHTYPAVNFADVGIYSVGDYDIVLILDQPMTFFNEDGSLSYLAAYNFGSLPLVKKDLYEACKHEPQADSTLWTTDYCTSLQTSASWGPYKLVSFQEGKSFRLERNENWFGYGLETNKGQYLTDAIETEVIVKEEAQQMAFWKGEVDGLGISVVLADDYRNSPYAVYSPRVANFAINIYSDLNTLIAKKRNNTVQSIKEFRQALSLSLDRDAYNRDLSTASQTCLGFLTEDYYHNVAEGEVYRDTIQAKETLLLAYGFSKTDDGKWTDGVETYADVDAATKAMTGMNIPLAKQKLEEAWTELQKPEYQYDPSKKIQICYGASEESDGAKREYNWINNWLTNLFAGTSFEGKVELIADYTFGSEYFDEFDAGNFDISTAGVGNAPYDPFYFVGAWTSMSSSVNYHVYLDTNTMFIEYTLPTVEGFAQSGQTLELSALDWYNSLNGNVTEDVCSYDWKAAPVEVRLDILAMIERWGLQQYYSIPTTRGMTASLHSAKWNYISDEYNTMMGFGGIRYITYNYTDAEWADFVASQGGDLSEFYKGTN